VVPADDVIRLAKRLEGTAVVVVDEAYIEFADAPSLVPLVSSQPNLAVLRTLSKAHALAGARIGCLIADPDLVGALRRCQAPYPIAEPSAACAVQALSPQALALTARSIAETCEQRQVLRMALTGLPCVLRIYPSQGNFLLVRFDDASVAMQRLLDAGIVVRDMRHLPQLGDALRISIGNAEQNARVIACLQALVPA
jgi:histidinol-phosphate aminotransferase